MRHFAEYYMTWDDETDSAQLVRDEYYDYDDGSTTRHPTPEEINKWLNDVVYEEQINALVYEAEPLIAAWSRVTAYYLKHNAQHAKPCGEMAQRLYNETRARIERDAGIG